MTVERLCSGITACGPANELAGRLKNSRPRFCRGALSETLSGGARSTSCQVEHLLLLLCDFDGKWTTLNERAILLLGLVTIDDFLLQRRECLVRASRLHTAWQLGDDLSELCDLPQR